MKGRIFVAVLLVAAAALAGRWVNRASSPHVGRQEETRQTFRLEPGARVEVAGINGSVEVTTYEGDAAEVQVVRAAEDADDLEYGRVAVDGTPTYLSVRGERSGGRGLLRWLLGGGSVRQQVRLQLPRRVDFSVSGVNGPVRVGELDGAVEVIHVNGRVDVAQSSGRFEVQHVNGNVTLGVTRPGPQGLDVAHVNGNVEIRLKQAVDADVEVQRQNGNLSLDVPNVTMQERQSRSSARARIGNGGSPFQISRVNGNVRFVSDASAGSGLTASDSSPADDFDAPLPPLPPAPPVPPAPPAP